MQGITQKVGNDHRENGRDAGSRSSRVKQCLHMTIPTFLVDTEDPHNNDNYLYLSGTTCLGALVWGSIVVAVNIPLF